MGNWEWLVPVIILVIWIINHVLRGGEEDQPANRNRAEGKRQSEGRPARKSSTEIDLFLEEINRRRKQAGERKVAPPPRQQAASSGASSARAARPGSSTRQPTARPATAARLPRQAPERRPPERPVVPREVVEVVAVETTPMALPPVPSPYEQPPVLPSVAAVTAVGDYTSSLETERLAALLGSADTLRTAFVLKEIFGPPRCMRKGSH